MSAQSHTASERAGLKNQTLNMSLWVKNLSTWISPFQLDFHGGPVGKNLPQMQGTWVQSLVSEDSTCHGAAAPESHSY